jgi:hypothetical protein
VSPRLPGSRNAIAGLGLAAAGVVIRRFSGRKPASQTPAPEAAQPAPQADSADGAELSRARSELAEELARRASRSDA